MVVSPGGEAAKKVGIPLKPVYPFVWLAITLATPGGGNARLVAEGVGEDAAVAVRGGFRGASTWGKPKTLADHFARHGTDFGVRTADDYAEMASGFLRRSQAERLPTKIDPQGVIRVYDPKTNTFGAFNPNGTTRTFYKPTRGEAYWADQPGVSPWTP